ncbi:MAG: hypothetical protein NTV73_04770 [Hyphomicrobiales bacterium]|nr:hypothetical protein [Hyphomicrobiales bacterium]
MIHPRLWPSVTIGGKSGFHTLRGVYSTLHGTDLGDIPDLILPGGAENLGKVDGYWFASYAFQQYLVQDQQNPSRGWGIFGQIAVQRRRHTMVEPQRRWADHRARRQRRHRLFPRSSRAD